ncbi:hypothetical protein [Methylomonas sp. LWB]|uniref:hypothetical protein n=1 Tax=Methylomonas sp. LWB TaxID=1905845 RepID=UPI001115170C|nr:hypothetical protein [Methylomonas sp. LWB]
MRQPIERRSLPHSRHLDIPQKSEYSEKIEQLILEIREHREPIRLDELNSEMAEKFAEIERLLQPERREQGKDILESIASLGERKREVSLRTEESRERVMAVVTTLLGVTTALATSLIGSKFFDTVSSSPVTLIVGKLFPLMGALLVVVVALQFLLTTLRIKRRAADSTLREGKSDG